LRVSKEVAWRKLEVGDGFDPESATESVGPTTFFLTSFYWLLSSSAVSKNRLPVAL